MGCMQSQKTDAVQAVHADEEEWPDLGWRTFNTKFDQEGTMSYNHNLEFRDARNCLDEFVGRRHLRKYLEKLGGKSPEESKRQMTNFKAWVTFQDFKELAVNKRLGGLKSIYKKYIDEAGEYCIKSESKKEVEKVKAFLSAPTEPVPMDILQELQNECFIRFYSETFSNFKKNERYPRIAHDRVKMYNRVHPDDFDWMEIIGEGGFGKVVRVRKKTTGKMFAMKVQSKHLILQGAHGDGKACRMERDILAESENPFICELHYAFQTDKQVLLALELMSGDASKAIKNSGDDIVDEEVTKYWMAQIFLAIKYLHDSGLVYRDLKPANILIDHDGNAILTDMGICAILENGFAVEEDEAAEKKKEEQKIKASNVDETKSITEHEEEVLTMQHGPMTRKSSRSSVKASGETSSLAENSRADSSRRKSLGKQRGKATKKILEAMGTYGFRAPEMLGNQGYGAEVDWWAFGITIYKMLYGKIPYDDAGSMTVPTAEIERNSQKKDLVFPSTPKVSEQAKDIITKLLHKDFKFRLGNNATEFQNHPWFQSINWDSIMHHTSVSPYKAQELKFDKNEKPAFKTFEDAMSAFDLAISMFGGETDDSHHIRKREQKLFESWEFVHRENVREESAIFLANKKKKEEEENKKKVLEGKGDEAQMSPRT